MKKYIIGAMITMAAMTASAQDVLKITLNDGSEQIFNVADVKEMTFEAQQTTNMVDKFVGQYTGTQTLVVGGMFSYSTPLTYTLTAGSDGTLTVSIPQYSLSGTQMGDLTLGALTIEGLTYDEEKQGFYRFYANDGLTQHFLAVNNGNTVFDNDYTLGGESSILITLNDKGGIDVANPFKLGAMPLSLTASFTSPVEEESEPTLLEQYAGQYTGTQSVTVGGMYTYTTTVDYTLTAEDDGTLTVSIPEYSLTGTMMGDLTLGAVTIKGLAYDEEKGGFYRFYANDGLKQHFLAVNNGATVFDNEYDLGGESSILVKRSENGDITVENPFKLGAMPLPLTASYTGTRK